VKITVSNCFSAKEMLEAGTAEKQKKKQRRHIGLQERGKEFRGANPIFSALLFEPRNIRMNLKFSQCLISIQTKRIKLFIMNIGSFLCKDYLTFLVLLHFAALNNLKVRDTGG
jgi:hypothetical protein